MSTLSMTSMASYSERIWYLLWQMHQFQAIWIILQVTVKSRLKVMKKVHFLPSFSPRLHLQFCSPSSQCRECVLQQRVRS